MDAMQHVTYKLLSPQRNIQTKYVAHMSPTATVTMVCHCCHGSKVSIATKCYHGLLLFQEICVPNMKHVCFQTAK